MACYYNHIENTAPGVDLVTINCRLACKILMEQLNAEEAFYTGCYRICEPLGRRFGGNN
jgi:hypothetical protein